MTKIEEITLNDYVLTNIDIETGCFVIRLKDDKEYIVYCKELKSGEYGDFAKFFIEKDNKEISLNREVVEIFLKEMREYEREGI